VILQNPIDEHGATSVDSLWQLATNHGSLRTTEVEGRTVARKSWGFTFIRGALRSCRGGLTFKLTKIPIIY